MISQWRDPPTRDGLVWLQQFNEALASWLASGSKDAATFAQAVQSLQFLFERCPGYSPEVAQIALHTATIGRLLHADPQAVVDIARTGLDAATTSSLDRSVKALPTALLALALAEAYLASGQRFAGLDALRHAERELATIPDKQPMTLYACSRLKALKGELEELGLEAVRASQAFLEAADLARFILEDPQAEASFPVEWVRVMMDPVGDRPEQPWVDIFPLAVKDLGELYTRALFGLARTALDPAEALRAARQAVEKYGLPLLLDPGDLARMVTRFGSTFSFPEAQDFVNELMKKFAGRIEQKPEVPFSADNWLALILAALVRGYPQPEHTKETKKLISQIQESFEIPISAAAHAVALGYLLAYHYHRAGGKTNRMVLESRNDFLNSLVGLGELVGAQEFLIKVLLEEAVVITLKLVYEEWEKVRRNAPQDEPGPRTSLANLIDFLRQPRWRGIPYVAAPESLSESPALVGLLLLQDRLPIIHHALHARPETAVIVLQSFQDSTLFLGLAGDQPEILAALAGREYREAALNLARQAQEELEFAGLALGGVQDDGLRPAACEAFAALPASIQELIQKKSTLILAPDFRDAQDRVPFELMHDGQSYLSLKKVVARVASLSQVVQILTRFTDLNSEKRAVCAAIPEVEGYPELEYSRPEAAAVRRLLQLQGWDAPEISTKELLEERLLGLMEQASLLHLSAHGETTAGEEALLLPERQRLTTEDLLRRHFTQLPFIYLDTCFLGASRYLGGGVSRGMAFTLVETGAPAVIANLTPVVDENAATLALAFYRYAQAHPVGEALRRARMEVYADGRLPVYWGATVLAGDPLYVLPGAHPESPVHKPSEAIQALGDMLAVVTNLTKRDQKAWKKVYRAARKAYEHDPEDMPLQAGLLWVQSIAVLDEMEPADFWIDEEVEWITRLADELGYLPAMAIPRMYAADAALAEGDDEYTQMAIEDLLEILDPLSRKDEGWARVRLSYLGKLKKIQLASEGIERRYMGPEPDQETREGMDDIVDLLYAVDADQERAGEISQLRDLEETLEDIAWNAVVIGHPNRFEAPPEAATFCQELAQKLHMRNFLKAENRPYAATLLTGLLYHLWGMQHVAYLEPDLAAGQAGTLIQAVKDLNEHWSPPEGQPWFEIIRDFPNQVDRALALIESQTYDTVYDVLEPQIKRLAKTAKSILKKIRKNYPQSLAGCSAYIQGVLIEKNTFSPLDGSVPEDIGENLKQAYIDVSENAEVDFQGYLMPGFEYIRTRDLDDLDRWKYGLGDSP